MSQTAQTRPATARRLRRARQQGDHPLSHAAISLGACVASMSAANYLATQTVSQLEQLLVRALHGDSGPISTIDWLKPVATITSPLLASAMLGALAVGLVQTRGQISLEPLGGLHAIMARAPRSFARRFGTSLTGLVVFSLMLVWALNMLSHSGAPLAAATGDVRASTDWLADQGKRTLSLVLAVGLGAAATDCLRQRFLWLRRNQMSNEELNQEQRQTEADPNLRQLRRQVHQQALRETEMERLTQTILLVTGPGWVTTALAYRPARNASPYVVLQAAGAMGSVMQSEARKRALPFLQDARLSRILSRLAPDDPIPESSFAAIARAIATNEV